MPRYIDIEPIENAAEEYVYSTVSIALIKEQHTADVRENVHGEWIDKLDDEGKWEETVCSVCGKGCGEVIPVWNFCPNCGADMRERRDNVRKSD